MQSQQVFTELYLSFCPTFSSTQTLNHSLLKKKKKVGPPEEEVCGHGAFNVDMEKQKPKKSNIQ